MAVAIEDAGFQIRDQIMWVYGSGFPKSHNIEKAINKVDGVEFLEKPASGVGFMNAEGAGGYNTTINQLEQVGQSTERAAQWNGWGTALKPAHEPMVLARKPLEGTVANNVLTYGVGGLNIDGTRVGFGDEQVNLDAVQINIDAMGYHGAKNSHSTPTYKPAGRFPANFIHDGSDEVVALFPDTKSPATYTRKSDGFGSGSYVIGETAGTESLNYGDTGSAARFFYCAKASKRDRNEGLEAFEAKRDHDGRKDGGVGGDNPRNRTNNAKVNHHPTVKPTTLMQYLVRLVTPPNGTVLDPFMGSGSTGKACAYEGFDFIGIDQSAEYVEIARARIFFAIATDDESEV
jgi:site-specific DNA-methyltransferase (adenine-specific)